MDVAAEDERGMFALDRLEDRPAAEVSVSALPGTSTAGTAIALRASIVLSSPVRIVA
jgi:hypothetical protein